MVLVLYKTTFKYLRIFFQMEYPIISSRKNTLYNHTVGRAVSIPFPLYSMPNAHWLDSFNRYDVYSWSCSMRLLNTTCILKMGGRTGSLHLQVRYAPPPLLANLPKLKLTWRSCCCVSRSRCGPQDNGYTANPGSSITLATPGSRIK